MLGYVEGGNRVRVGNAGTVRTTTQVGNHFFIFSRHIFYDISGSINDNRNRLSLKITENHFKLEEPVFVMTYGTLLEVQ